MGREMDHLLVLKALQEIPFGVGKKLLTEFLQGKEKHESISKNKLQELASYGSMVYSDNELGEVVERLILNGLITMKSLEGNRFWKVMELSAKGVTELTNPTCILSSFLIRFLRRRLRLLMLTGNCLLHLVIFYHRIMMSRRRRLFTIILIFCVLLVRVLVKQRCLLSALSFLLSINL